MLQHTHRAWPRPRSLFCTACVSYLLRYHNNFLYRITTVRMWITIYLEKTDGKRMFQGGKGVKNYPLLKPVVIETADQFLFGIDPIDAPFEQIQSQTVRPFDRVSQKCSPSCAIHCCCFDFRLLTPISPEEYTTNKNKKTIY